MGYDQTGGAGNLMALTNQGYDPNDIFGGYGENPYGTSSAMGWSHQPQPVL